MSNITLDINKLDEYTKELSLSQTRTEPIYQKPPGWIIKYKNFSSLADDQAHVFWPWSEIPVDNDVQDLRVKATPSEKSGILSVLKLFTHYEVRVGDDYWTGRIMNTFKRPEIQRMASMFSAVEFNSHAPFYNKINEVLFVDTEEFYDDWRNDPTLTERMKFIDDIASCEDDLVSIAAFSFLEGTVLYSSFAYLKHFQTQSCGKNLITNIVRGINLSVGDENMHAIAGALLFRTIMSERKLSDRDKELLYFIIKCTAEKVYEHESHIIDLIFSNGEINGLTSTNMKDFVKHRINVCMNELGYDNIYDDSDLDGFVASWFYVGINSIQFHDFFTSTGSEYHINWQQKRFGNVWRDNNEVMDV